MRAVIVHDFAETYGGAERVTAEIAAAYPEASVIALLGRGSVFERMGVAGRARSLLPARERVLDRYRMAAPFYPLMARAVRLERCDLVISSSYAYAHHFLPPAGSRHLCYLHSPLRFAWSMTEDYADTWAGAGPSRHAFAALAAWSRMIDRHAAARVDRFVTQSRYVAEQVERFYGAEAEVVGAPVDMDVFHRRAAGEEATEDLVLVSRLIEPYKRVGIVVEALRRMPGRRLTIVGDGPAYESLKASLPANVRMVGHRSDHEVAALMRAARAVVFPSRDDFGIVPVEAMACGVPVLAYRGGGALFTVAEGRTGAFFDRQDAETVEAALRDFDPAAYDPAVIRAHAEQWSVGAFRERMRRIGEQMVAGARSATGAAA